MAENISKKVYDFIIVGSGFGGSITAMGLAQCGYNILLIERGEHPRFTVGESSTPIADMILRKLSHEYNLPFLKQLSRYGEWQKHHPEVICGLKRGFSYYKHNAGKQFTSGINHENELLVAASNSDSNSDTNWLRSDVDQFLVKQVSNVGVDYLDKTLVKSVDRVNEKLWLVHAVNNSASMKISCRWIVDATGSPEFSEKYFGTVSSSDGLHTHSSAVYSHLRNVNLWSNHLSSKGINTENYPYNPDHSALHHIINEGWVWMLRFTNDLLSAGLMIDHKYGEFNDSPEVIWRKVIQKYPSIASIFKQADLASIPGEWKKTGRLQRRLDKMVGDGWLTLNHTAGFVDPMHSTGIAHALTGIEKILEIFRKKPAETHVQNEITNLQEEVFSELSFIDLLVSSTYYSRNNFHLFRASVMLYFISSIRYEQNRLHGNIPDTFLCAGDDDLHQLVLESHNEIKRYFENNGGKKEAAEIVLKIRERITPFNNVGLMDPEKRNMYEHTAVSL